jgi:hypothetical protein
MCVEKEALAEDINHLRKHNKLIRTSNLIKLKPVLSNDILRVGGRLERAPIHCPMKKSTQPFYPRITTSVY